MSEKKTEQQNSMLALKWNSYALSENEMQFW